MATLGVGRSQETARCAAQNAAGEELNDERGIKPLLVSLVRDGAELGMPSPDLGRGELLCSAPRNHPATAGWKLWESGSFPHTGGRPGTHVCPTDVTDQEKSSANRGRSSAAGVVAGAWESAR